MVWVDNWETFYAEAEKLYIEHPDHVRATLSPPMIAQSLSPSLCLSDLHRRGT